MDRTTYEQGRIIGYSEPEETLWPGAGDVVFSISGSGVPEQHIWTEADSGKWRIGNCFRSEKEARDALQRLRIRSTMDKLAVPPASPGMCYCVVYLPELDAVDVRRSDDVFYGCPVFESADLAWTVIRLIGEDRLRKYWFGAKEMAV